MTGSETARGVTNAVKETTIVDEELVDCNMYFAR